MPIIEFYPHTKGYFTVFLVDPDAPNPAFVHLLFVNVEGEKGIKSSISSRKSSSDIGNIVVPYMPPSPPSGVHRYVVLVSYQKNISRRGFTCIEGRCRCRQLQRCTQP